MNNSSTLIRNGGFLIFGVIFGFLLSRAGATDPALISSLLLFENLHLLWVIATAVGVAFAFIDVELPEAVTRLIDYLAQAAAPCALFAMGVTLALRPLKRVPLALGYIVPIKLIVHPMLMYFLLSWIGDFDPVWIYTAVLIASLPTATNVFVMAQQYGVWIERASASVLITTALSVVTVSGLLYIVTTGILPPDWWPAG